MWGLCPRAWRPANPRLEDLLTGDLLTGDLLIGDLLTGDLLTGDLLTGDLSVVATFGTATLHLALGLSEDTFPTTGFFQRRFIR